MSVVHARRFPVLSRRPEQSRDRRFYQGAVCVYVCRWCATHAARGTRAPQAKCIKMSGARRVRRARAHEIAPGMIYGETK